MPGNGAPDSLQTRVLRYFVKISDDPNDFMYRCLIEKNCRQQNGRKLCNIVAHAKTHREFFRDQILIESAKLKGMPLKRLEFIQHCTEIVTINGQPYSDLNASGFKKLNAEKLQELTDAGYGIGLKPPKYPAVRKQIEYLSSEIINQIKQEVTGKFVSLMVDTASKYQRTILGINVQFMLGSSIVIRSIGMMHLDSSHTAQHIADVIFEQLNVFKIKTAQLIAITTDNARNMTAMVNRFNVMFEENDADNDESDGHESEEEAEYVQIEELETDFQFQLGLRNEDVHEVMSKIVHEMELEDPKCNDDLISIINDEPDTERLLRELEDILEKHTLKINGIRCAVHTLQLAVKSALNHENFKTLISLCRAVCKELRKNTNINELRIKNIRFNIPRIDCKTRWNSTYRMVSVQIFAEINCLHYFLRELMTHIQKRISITVVGLDYPLQRRDLIFCQQKKSNELFSIDCDQMVDYK